MEKTVNIAMAIKQGDYYVRGYLCPSDYQQCAGRLQQIMCMTEFEVIDLDDDSSYEIDLLELYETIKLEIDNTEMLYDWFVRGDFRQASTVPLHRATCYNVPHCLPYELVHQVLRPLIVYMLAIDWLAGDEYV